MRKSHGIISVIIVIFLALCVVGCNGDASFTPSGENNVTPSGADVFSAYENSVVEVSALNAKAAGVVLETDDDYAYIVTCAHVYAAAGHDPEIVYIRRIGEFDYRVGGEILGYDEKFDMAFLRFPVRREAAAPAHDGTALRTGEEMYAIGNAAGDGIAIFGGLASRLDELVYRSGGDIPVIRTSAEINVGMSGGALTDNKGGLRGILFGKKNDNKEQSFAAMGYAVPMEIVSALYRKAKAAPANKKIEYNEFSFYDGLKTGVGAPQAERTLTLGRDGVSVKLSLVDGLIKESNLAGLDVGEKVAAINGVGLESPTALAAALIEGDKIIVTAGGKEVEV